MRPRYKPEHVLSIAEVGWLLGKSYNQVARLIARHELHAARPANRWQIEYRHVQQYLRSLPRTKRTA